MSQALSSQLAPQSPSDHPEGPLVVSAAQDEVTIANRDQWYSKYSQAFSQALRENLAISVIIGDATALKAVNDELGHDEGDALLKAVSTAFTNVVAGALRTENDDQHSNRPLDIVGVSHISYKAYGSTAGRIGGDEYGIVLPDTDATGAAVVLERIRKDFDAHLEGPAGDRYRSRGISAGLALGAATLQTDMVSPSDLLRAADQAMYVDKMSQLAPLTQERMAHLLTSLEHLVKAEVRPRDLPRYIEYLGSQGLLGADLKLALTKPEIPQEVGAEND